MRLIFLIIICIQSKAYGDKVTLQQLLSTAAEHNYSVQSQKLEADAKGRLVKASDAFGNPQVLIETQRGSDNTGSPINNLKATLLQPISSPWSLRLKKKVASVNYDISHHHFEDSHLSAQVNMLKAIFDFNSQMEILRAMEEREKRFKMLQTYIRTRKNFSPQRAAESMIVANRMAIIQREISIARVHIDHIWNSLNRYLNWKDRQTFPVFRVHAPVQLHREEMLNKLKSQNHDIELSQLEQKHAEAVRDQAQWQKWPDIALAASKVSGRSGNPEDNYSLGVNVSLPLFNMNRNMAKSTELTALASEKNRLHVYQDVLLAFNETFETYQVLREFLVQYPVAQLPQLHKDIDAISEGFKRGQVDLLTFFEADASAFERLQQTWTLQSQYVNSVADLSFLTGEIISVGGEK